MPLDRVAEFEKMLKKDCRAKWTVEVHAGTKHGYAFPGRKVYHEQASELSWQRTFEMFKRQL